MLLTTLSGTATFRQWRNERGGTVKVFTLFRKTARTLWSDEEHMNVAAKDPQSGVYQQGMDVIAASSENDNHGKWFLGQYQVPPQSLIRIEISKQIPGEGFGYNSFSMLLLMREAAAQRRLRIPLLNHHAATSAAQYVEGRFDIIAPHMFENFGIDVPPKELDKFEVNDYTVDYVTMQVVEEEISPLSLPRFTAIITNTGATKRVPGKGRRVLTVKGASK